MAGHRRVWTPYDDGLVRTAWIAALATAGRLHELDAVPAAFAPADSSERVLAVSPYELSVWAAPGDGSYRHSGSVVLASGRSGLTITADVAAGVATGNARRRRRAAQNAVPRWLPSERGSLWVSTHGFRLQSVHGLAFWTWQLIDSIRCLGLGAVEVQGRAATGGLYRCSSWPRRPKPCSSSGYALVAQSTTRTGYAARGWTRRGMPGHANRVSGCRKPLLSYRLPGRRRDRGRPQLSKPNPRAAVALSQRFSLPVSSARASERRVASMPR